MRLLLVPAFALACMAASAQTVSLSGSMGERALLMINGTPKTLAVGASHQGVRLVSMSAGEAVVEIGGKRATLVLGGAQVNLGGAPSAGGGKRIVLSAGSGGHFMSSGSINGKAVSFMVDTGATTIAISEADANRIGLDFRNGPRGMAATANGQVPVHRALLGSVRVGDVTVYDVEAMVVPLQMPYVLLGNSFLNRFQMKRENDVMTLERRF
jgi:aspartyl protease family protein